MVRVLVVDSFGFCSISFENRAQNKMHTAASKWINLK